MVWSIFCWPLILLCFSWERSSTSGSCPLPIRMGLSLATIDATCKARTWIAAFSSAMMRSTAVHTLVSRNVNAFRPLWTRIFLSRILRTQKLPRVWISLSEPIRESQGSNFSSTSIPTQVKEVSSPMPLVRRYRSPSKSDRFLKSSMRFRNTSAWQVASTRAKKRSATVPASPSWGITRPSTLTLLRPLPMPMLRKRRIRLINLRSRIYWCSESK